MSSPFPDAQGRKQRCMECHDRMPKLSADECMERLSKMPKELRDRYTVNTCMSCKRSEIALRPPPMDPAWKEALEKAAKEREVLGPRVMKGRKE